MCIRDRRNIELPCLVICPRRRRFPLESSSGTSPRSVSYTHLDVYKRQRPYHRYRVFRLCGNERWFCQSARLSPPFRAHLKLRWEPSQRTDGQIANQNRLGADKRASRRLTHYAPIYRPAVWVASSRRAVIASEKHERKRQHQPGGRRERCV